jgi:lysophospholipase L1-like esterase
MSNIQFKRFQLIFQVFFIFKINYILAQNAEYNFINYNSNIIQYSEESDIKTICKSWKDSRRKKVVILHLGDSHLQNENFPNKCRNILQNMLGDGGIGLIQPFSIVRTYDASFYKTSHTGIWDYSKSFMIPPKLTLGVRGMTALTKDENSTFKIVFKDTLSNANSILTLFCGNTDSSFIPDIYFDSIKASLLYTDGDLRIYQLSKKIKSISLKLTKTNQKQNNFIIYGMSLSNNNDYGCVWHNAGVGASQYKSVLFETKYSEEVTYLDPDLVIIDFGTNDFLYENKVPIDLKFQIYSVIEKVKNTSPNATILLTSAQDMIYKKRNVSASMHFSKLVKEIAIEKHCAFWDWYSIAGGSQTMKLWILNQLAMKDGIHLTAKGSEIKAELLVNALKNLVYSSDNRTNTFENSIDSLEKNNKKSFNEKNEY